MPLVPCESSRKTAGFSPGVHLRMRLVGTSLKTRKPSRDQTGPSVNASFVSTLLDLEFGSWRVKQEQTNDRDKRLALTHDLNLVVDTLHAVDFLASFSALIFCFSVSTLPLSVTTPFFTSMSGRRL